MTIWVLSFVCVAQLAVIGWLVHEWRKASDARASDLLERLVEVEKERGALIEQAAAAADRSVEGKPAPEAMRTYTRHPSGVIEYSDGQVVDSEGQEVPDDLAEMVLATGMSLRELSTGDGEQHV